MDFEKKYPITQQPGDFLTVQWTRGFKQVAVYYKGELAGTVEGAGRLQKGTRLSHPTLGTIELKLSEKPVTLSVIVDGYHSPVNVNHPVKELKGLSAFFWMLLAFSFLAGALEIGLFADYPPLLAIVGPMNVGIMVIYLIAVLNIRQGRPWAYYMAVGVFGFFTVISLLVLLFGFIWGTLPYLFEVVRIGALVIFLINLKTANAARKHLRYGTVQLQQHDDLLDARL